jgi:hypothetical protein
VFHALIAQTISEGDIHPFAAAPRQAIFDQQEKIA